MVNPYKVLGVADNSSKDICKKAYRQLCTRYHPDSVTGDREKFEEVNKAWGMIESGKFTLVTLTGARHLSHSSLLNFSVISG